MASELPPQQHVSDLTSSVSLEQLRLGGELLIMGVPGVELDEATRATIEKVQPGGFILFGRNIRKPEQLRKLIDDLRLCVRHEPVITIDQEGGRVSRLRELGSEPPSAKQLRDKGDTTLIDRHGELVGKQLRLFGFNLNLAPVLDVSFDDAADNSLKNRTWGLHSPEQVVENAGAFTRAMRGQGILSCGKHFPGYSSAGIDPHHELPVLDRTRAELEGVEWIAFQKLLPEMDSLMIGHALYPDLDNSGEPASLSPRVVDGILRKDWGYDGIVISDDLDMGAILNHCSFEDSMQRAIIAGNDLLLLCHRVHLAPQAAAAIGSLPADVLEPALRRVRALRTRLAEPFPFTMELFQDLDAQVARLRIDTLGAEVASSRSAEDGKRSPVELF
ncbi:MAG TPA: glycoside hydrolase family 3 protein [Candidatus Methylacidiphilales bacterium]|nr:glycoside hydrolase family 3 protein [Candidatus Methylacidiphilales bacterium]